MGGWKGKRWRKERKDQTKKMSISISKIKAAMLFEENLKDI